MLCCLTLSYINSVQQVEALGLHCTDAQDVLLHAPLRALLLRMKRPQKAYASVRSLACSTLLLLLCRDKRHKEVLSPSSHRPNGRDPREGDVD